jgi:RNA polymerase sigma-70 factor (ECF subfamily)
LQGDEAKIKFVITGCRDGSRKAQEMLYRHFFSYGMNVALRYGRDRQEAEDILQEGFFKAFRGMDSYNDELPFKTWLRRVLVNAAIDYLRKHKIRFAEIDERSSAVGEAVNDGLEQLKYAELLAAIHQLTPAYRLVFNLYAIEGYRHREIAEKLSISEGTSKSNYAKARRKLQTYLLHREGAKKEWL